MLPLLNGANAPLAIGGGKEGKLYLVNQNNLGHYGTVDDVIQEWQAGNGAIHGAPVYWNGSLYIWTDNDVLHQYAWSNGSFLTSAVHNGAAYSPFPGGILSLSANGTAPGTGILWGTSSTSSANHQTVPGELHAYDASNVSVELWNSYMNQSRDDFGILAKFCPPTVVNGRVFMATFSNQLVVYGLLSTLTAPSNLAAQRAPTQISLSWTASTGSAGIAGYAVFRTAGSQTVKVGTSNTTSFTDYGLTPRTRYTYYVQAFDVNGNYSSPSAALTVHTRR
jgi:hypothetical protein